MSERQTMWSPFLIFRSTLFALLAWLNVIALGFAIWDIVAMKKAGSLTTYGPPIFVIFNSCATFLLLLSAIAELCIRDAKTTQVNFECGWTFVMAVLHFASAVDMTVMGPPQFCSDQDFISVCAASTVLVIVTWLSSVTMMLYFLGLYMTAISHYWVYGGIWTTTVYNVPWFTEPTHISQTLTKPRRKTVYDTENPVFRSSDEDDIHGFALTPSTADSPYSFTSPGAGLKVPVLNHAHSQETLRPTWAKSVKMRRGVDQPFVLPGAKHLSRMIKACMPDAPLMVPPKAKLYELPRLDLDLSPRYPSYSQFPVNVHDEDKPIRFQRVSQWVRADSGPQSA